MPNVAMKHEKDPREQLLEEIGDVSSVKIEEHQILLAIYRRPEKTRGGIVLTQSNLNEDLYQSKAHLIVKMGSKVNSTLPLKLHDWVVIKPSDGWDLEVNFTSCRMAYGDHIRAIIDRPGVVW
jgi:hypothetical protein